MASFGERLKALRTGAGLSQPGLAEKASVPVWTLRNYEQGRREPSWHALLALCKALGVQAEAFADCMPSVDLPAPEPAPTAKVSKPKAKPRKRKDGAK